MHKGDTLCSTGNYNQHDQNVYIEEYKRFKYYTENKESCSLIDCSCDHNKSLRYVCV